MISPGMSVHAMVDFFRGVHHPGDVYKIALYDEGAVLNSLTSEYTTEHEVKGKGYQRGGMELSGYTAELDGMTPVMGWTVDPIWRNATISARGALIYNASKRNRAIVVVDFGDVIRSTNGNFRVPMPPVTASEALIYAT